MTGIPIRALIVEDEPAVRRFLRTTLQPRGFQISEARNGQEAIALVASSRPQVILLDLGLPDVDGIELTRSLREWSSTPIVILSVRGSEEDKVAALDAGADDYLTKPFGVAELLARLRANLRRVNLEETEQAVVTSGAIQIDFTRRVVSLSGQPLHLTPTEYDILRVLARQGGKLMSHSKLIQEVWGHSGQAAHTLRVNVSNLRRKIESDGQRVLITEPGVGYRFLVDP